MERRQVLALVGAGASALAGCSTTSSNESPTETGQPSGQSTATTTQRPTDSPTQSPTESATESATPSETATPVFNPVIYFDSCTEISVQATNYDEVTLFFADALQTFSAGYTKQRSFSGTGEHEASVIHEVSVRRGNRTVDRSNPEVDACEATPTPTPTETESPTPTPNPKTEERITYETDVDRSGDDLRVNLDGENGNDYTVELEATVTYYHDGEAIKSHTQEHEQPPGGFYYQFTYDGNKAYVDSVESEISARRAR